MILFAMKILFWLANKNKEVKTLLGGWNRTIKFDIDSTTPFHVKTQDGFASVIKGNCEKPDLIMKATNSNFRRMLKGDIKFEEAFLRKQIDAVGSIHDAARFKRIIGLVLESHNGLITAFRLSFGKLM